MLHHSLLLPSTNKWRRDGHSRSVDAVGLDQKELALPEFKEWLAAQRIGALTQHLVTSSRSLMRFFPSTERWFDQQFRCHEPCASRCSISLPELKPYDVCCGVILPTFRQSRRLQVYTRLPALYRAVYHLGYA